MSFSLLICLISIAPSFFKTSSLSEITAVKWRTLAPRNQQISAELRSQVREINRVFRESSLPEQESSG